MPGKPWHEPEPLAHTSSKLAMTLTKIVRVTIHLAKEKKCTFCTGKGGAGKESGEENDHFDDDCVQRAFDISFLTLRRPLT